MKPVSPTYGAVVAWSLRALALLLMLGFGGVVSNSAQAQSNNVQTLLEQLKNGTSPQQILNQVEQGNQPQQPRGPQATVQNLSEAQNVQPPARPAGATSALEKSYSARLGQPISQFGYNLVGNGGSVMALQIGAVQDDYIMGPGDNINVSIVGPQNSNYTASIDRDGNVQFLNLPPISASGRRFGDFRRDLDAAIKRTYLQSQAYITIGTVRQLSVRVVGAVSNPGVYAATGLSTVLDALNLAGGITKEGSLRNVTVVRGGRSFAIDLYSMLLTHGTTPDLTLAQGDRIVVPPIGATIAIAGDVRRPGIYELSRGRTAASARELIALANGPEIRGLYRESILHIRPDGRDELVDITGNSRASARDGEILVVSRAVEASLGKVALVGAVRLPGNYGLNRVKTLQDLLSSPDVFAPGPYMLMGVIKRVDPKTLARYLIPFSPLRVLLKRENMSLTSNDTVYILDTDTMRELANSDTLIEQASAADQAPPDKSPLDNAPLDRAPLDRAALDRAALDKAPEQSASTDAAEKPSSLVSQLLGLTTEESSQLKHVLTEHLVTLTGSVRDAGAYLVAPGTTLDELVAAAGGTDLHADLSGFEVTSTLIDPATGLSTTTRQTYHLQPAQYSSLTLRPYDNVKFREVFSNHETGSVVVDGEVRYPGTYELLRGERLSSVLARAGGLTDEAYPYGAVFTRPSVGKREDEAHSREADDIESAIGAYLTTGATTGQQQVQVDRTQTAGLQALLARLRSTKSIGRIAIEADPAVLAVEPQFDLLLMPGDHLVIPQRAASVLIAGEVLKPNSVLFDPGMSVKDYIDAAGGTTELADTGNIYIIYPNGSAAPVSNSLLSFKNTKIAPGSTVIVPREIALPTPLLQFVTAIASIVKDLALSAASVAVLNK